jgi:outer membrane receptor protein involved in Fe transport
LYVNLGRSFRIPSLSELDSNSRAFDPDFPRVGNPELVSEFSWRQEVGCRYRNLLATFYRRDYQNYIMNRWNAFEQYYHTVNIPRVDFMGVETVLDMQLAWGFRFGFGGDYLIHSEEELAYPKYNAAVSLSRQTEKGRARFKIFGQGRYLGPRFSWGGSDHRPVFNFGALVRFVTLTAILRVDNILDDEVDDFCIPERDISLSVKWEFVD